MKTELKLPYFSVIIPVYRDTERLRLCLDKFSIMENSCFEFEVVVVNNDPENPNLGLDPTIYNYHLKEVYEPCPGSYAARNKGISEAKGKILGFTDSDCLPSDDWLQVAFDHFSNEKKYETGVLTGPVPLFFKDAKALSDAEVYEKYTGFTTEAYAKEGHAITANWFSNASTIREFGGFKADLKSNGDSELSGRISKKYKIIHSPKLIVHHPSRYYTKELVSKYKRLIGGTYSRRFVGKNLAFLKHILDFGFRRYRFWLNRSRTVTVEESLALLRVCNAINFGVFMEYFSLVKGGDTKR
ncbi:glycosyltransferase family 2 protein [Aquiflexum sp. LQ15W]|uniref:glycosyltransferase n=1 Tax=Cognataquiflexum nitidum TaxID=2922272 RepID=UPI001F141FD2|nr:glycosyltransferase family A protein [Cognataquiflexum nitidum]MCH6202102.1 glycosyltransferase family 2 protein [Cognataquiflexum nitidum]